MWSLNYHNLLEGEGGQWIVLDEDNNNDGSSTTVSQDIVQLSTYPLVSSTSQLDSYSSAIQHKVHKSIYIDIPLYSLAGDHFVLFLPGVEPVLQGQKGSAPHETIPLHA